MPPRKGNKKKPEEPKPFVPRVADQALDAELEDFLRNPPMVNDYGSFRNFYGNLLRCLMLGKVDSKMTNAATYMGSVLILGLDREKQQGMSAQLQQQFAELREIRMTPEQAALWLRQQSQEESIKLITKIAQENAKAEVIEADIVADIPWEPETPAERRLAKIIDRGAPLTEDTSSE